MNFRIATAALWMLGAGLAGAAHAGEGDEAEQAALLAVLQQETEIATKTRMNADFVPGIVTILEGERLRALGARTVWDAMPYVPGVQAVLDAQGRPSVLVRGVQFPFNSGSIQILLNGSPLAREAAGMNGSLLFLPLTQVERVEFIRGPGSVLYGDFAFQGLLNIVTRRTGDELNAEVGSDGLRSLDLRMNGERNDWRASLDLGAQEGDARVPLGSAADERQSSGIASVQRGGFSLQGQWFSRHTDDTDGHAPNVGTDESDTSLEARYAADLRENLRGEVRAQYLRNDLAGGISSFRGDQTRVLAELGYDGWQRQHWLGGIEYSTASIDEASIQPPPMPNQPPPPLAVLRDKSRSVRSAYLQDQVELAASLRATLGLRYDRGSDSGSRVTPRAALVWQPAEHHVLKAQYAEGTRAPTFFELYLANGTRRSLDFEVNRTAELNYVYERPQLVARATVFRTRIDDMVFPDFARQRGFGNFAHARAHGAEFELSRQVGETLRLDANLSWVKARDNRNTPLVETDLGQPPRWMGNLGLTWSPLPDWIGGLHWNRIGTRDAVQPGSGSYDLVDASLTRRHLAGDALDLQLGAQNLLNRRTVQIVSLPFGDQLLPYRDREAWLRATLRW